MVNVDLLISVGIWASGVGMSLVGIEMTINPPSDKSKWWYRSSFALLGLVFVGLSILQFDRTDKEAKRQSRIRQEERLQDVGNTRETQGEIRGIYDVLNKLSANSDPTKTQALLARFKTFAPPAEKLTWHWSVTKVIPGMDVEADLVVYPTQKLPSDTGIEIEFSADMMGLTEISISDEKVPFRILPSRMLVGNRLTFTTPSEIGPDSPILLKVGGAHEQRINFVVCTTCLGKL
jgi:hypothetical protein